MVPFKTGATTYRRCGRRVNSNRALASSFHRALHADAVYAIACWRRALLPSAVCLLTTPATIPLPANYLTPSRLPADAAAPAPVPRALPRTVIPFPGM